LPTMTIPEAIRTINQSLDLIRGTVITKQEVDYKAALHSTVFVASRLLGLLQKAVENEQRLMQENDKLMRIIRESKSAGPATGDTLVIDHRTDSPTCLVPDQRV
jgi:DNA anti-recombination protein RmuC